MNINEINNQGVKKLTSKVVGLGNAGIHILEHLATVGLIETEMLGVDCDARAISSAPSIPGCLIGRQLTGGMGTGGEPERGRAAAESDHAILKEFCAGADILFIVAGLGGGMGTGAAPVVARMAKEQGALVLAIVALPFEFEASRRKRQAEQGLLELKAAADSVICLPNQSLLKLVDDKTTAVDTFKLANAFLADGILGIWRLTTHQGLLNIDFNDLCSVTRGRHSVSSFATAEASGEHRTQQVLDKLLAHPLLENGTLLTEADNLLVSLTGGRDLGIAEINRLMEQVKRHCENAVISMGATIDEDYGSRISLTLIASRREKVAVVDGETQEPEAWTAVDRVSSVDEEKTEYKPSRPTPRFLAPAPSLTEEKKSEVFARQTGNARKKRTTSPRQGQLPLEIVSKGRFEKSEPTVYEGEDLDVPTYIRRGIALN
ncbi:MAG: Cell division protein FtsZ [Verrucomicrobiales bacterium]|nr:Cell division protein FtsZ [Verrucomicrobiales bacterium]